MTVQPLGDAAVVLHLDGAVDGAMAARVHAIAGALARARLEGVTDIVPAFASVAVFFERVPTAAMADIEADLRAFVAGAETEKKSPPGRVLEVPVVYGGEHGPDLEAVAAHAGLPAAEVIARHEAGDYLVHAIGFAPGFPYLGGLAAELATPRRAVPRAQVPARSVGIGGAQTGIYPLASPGGWNLIGRTPLLLFDPRREPAALLRAGDRVRFRAVAEADFSTASSKPPASERSAVDIEVLRAGMFTTVQDAGRRGHRAYGVPLGGAADPLALRIANLIAGNDEQAAGLECTLVGPTLRFHRDTVIAWGGAETEALPGGRPIVVRAGETLAIGALRRGCRGYLAIGGGVSVPPVLGSRSTLVRAGLGGLEGRELRDGDGLPLGAGRQLTGGRAWRIDERILPRYSAAPTVRVIPGAHAADFEGWPRREFAVSAQSDRMGVRLGGAVARRGSARELVSTPVAPGTIQVPPGGEPIVLLADAQTIGGYPQLAHVISADLPLVAQLRPGDAVRFVEVSLDEARRAAGAVERALGLLREGVARKFR
ncbi:MAG: 5-oxoprolinase subunit PxpB [Opitutaceae bacterium]|nr:5-oxoprolinase subunit PxpB [Opitutaceae bacterium]